MKNQRKKSFLKRIFTNLFTDTCKKPVQIAPFIATDCAGQYDRSTENKDEYFYNWRRPMEYFSGINPKSMPWRWQDSSGTLKLAS